MVPFMLVHSFRSPVAASCLSIEKFDSRKEMLHHGVEKAGSLCSDMASTD